MRRISLMDDIDCPLGATVDVDEARYPTSIATLSRKRHESTHEDGWHVLAGACGETD